MTTSLSSQRPLTCIPSGDANLPVQTLFKITIEGQASSIRSRLIANLDRAFVQAKERYASTYPSRS